MNRHQSGFTLLELLIALAITAVVATAAIAALDVFAEADTTATRRMDRDADTDRALQLLRRDVADAWRLVVQNDRVLLTRRDGTGIGWAITAGGTELHRFTGADAAAVIASTDTALAATVSAPTYTARGHLRDVDYRSSAVLQGAGRLQFAAIAPSSTTVGVQLRVQHGDGRVLRGVALSNSLAEGQSKAAAIQANGPTSGSGSGTGGGSAGGVVGDVVGGAVGGVTQGLGQTTSSLLNALGGGSTTTGNGSGK